MGTSSSGVGGRKFRVVTHLGLEGTEVVATEDANTTFRSISKGDTVEVESGDRSEEGGSN